MQEAKEEGLTYTPSPISKAGLKIAGELQTAGGQVITLRTGAIKSVHTKNNDNQQNNYHEGAELPGDAAAAEVFKADLFGNYEANVQAREKQREEWQHALIQ